MYLMLSSFVFLKKALYTCAFHNVQIIVTIHLHNMSNFYSYSNPTLSSCKYVLVYQKSMHRLGALMAGLEGLGYRAFIIEGGISELGSEKKNLH